MPMYKAGDEIEYSNGLRARVDSVFIDGGFVIYDYTEKRWAACQYDIDAPADEEVWSFVDEEDPFVDDVNEARMILLTRSLQGTKPRG